MIRAIRGIVRGLDLEDIMKKVLTTIILALTFAISVSAEEAEPPANCVSIMTAQFLRNVRNGVPYELALLDYTVNLLPACLISADSHPM